MKEQIARFRRRLSYRLFHTARQERTTWELMSWKAPDQFSRDLCLANAALANARILF